MQTPLHFIGHRCLNLKLTRIWEASDEESEPTHVATCLSLGMPPPTVMRHLHFPCLFAPRIIGQLSSIVLASKLAKTSLQSIQNCNLYYSALHSWTSDFADLKVRSQSSGFGGRNLTISQVLRVWGWIYCKLLQVLILPNPVAGGVSWV